MQVYIDKLNEFTKSNFVKEFFNWGGKIMMYGSFTFPLIVYLTKEQQSFGSLAWTFLVIIMMIHPMMDLFPSILLFQKFHSVRRSMGILCAMAAISHGIGVLFISSGFIDGALLLNSSQPYFYGFLGMLISIPLLLTSNNFSTRLLGRKWKYLQRGVHGMFYLVCIHVVFIGRYIDYGTLLLGIGIFILRFLAWKKTHTKSITSLPMNMNTALPEQYQCNTCSWIYDESKGDPDGGIAPGTRWEDIPDTWKCPICGIGKKGFTQIIRKASHAVESSAEDGFYLKEYERESDTLEPDFRSILEKAVSGKEEISAMGTKRNWKNLFEEIFFLPAQLAHRVYDKHEVEVNLDTVIGPKAKFPITLKLPFYVSHMSFGSLSREAKIALAKGSKTVGTMICGGEGGLLEEEFQNAGIYVFEYSTGRFGATEENMKKAHAIEIKVGQAAKAGLGGHLMGAKVTEEIAKVRGVEAGKDVISPANHTDIHTIEEMKERVKYLRELSGGKPIGIKIVASHIEDDLKAAIFCEPDFITIDCRGGATGAAPNHVKDNVCIPAPYAIYRARKFLDASGVGRDISLLVTGGFRTSADIAKAIALGADGVGVSTVAMIGIGCQQYRVCHKGTCPVGIATQNPDLRARFNMYKSTEMLVRLFHVYKEELEDFVRILGKKDIHTLDSTDLITTSSEISEHTNVSHA